MPLQRQAVSIDYDEDDDDLEHDLHTFLKAFRANKPENVYQTFSRMDAMSKQVQKMSGASVANPKEFCNSLRTKGMTDPHEQEDAVENHGENVRTSFTAQMEEKSPFDDMSCLAMEEHFVESLQRDPDLDMHLLAMLGPEGEEKMFLDHQRILEYFRHRNASKGRSLGLEFMKEVSAHDGDLLEELLSWSSEGIGCTGAKGAMEDEAQEDRKSSRSIEPDPKGNCSKEGPAASNTDGHQECYPPAGTPRRNGSSTRTLMVDVDCSKKGPAASNTDGHQECHAPAGTPRRKGSSRRTLMAEVDCGKEGPGASNTDGHQECYPPAGTPRSKGSSRRTLMAEVVSPPAGSRERRPPLMGTKKIIQTAGKHLLVSTKHLSKDHNDLDVNHGSLKEAGGRRSGPSTPRSVHPGGGSISLPSPRLEGFAMRKGMGRLMRRRNTGE